MLQKLLIAFPLSLILNYLVVFIYAGRDQMAAPHSQFFNELLGGFFALIFGFFGFLFRLAFTETPEIQNYPSPILLWIFVLATTAVVSYFLPAEGKKLNLVIITVVALPFLTIILAALVGQIRSL